MRVDRGAPLQMWLCTFFVQNFFGRFLVNIFLLVKIQLINFYETHSVEKFMILIVPKFFSEKVLEVLKAKSTGDMILNRDQTA